MATTRRVKRMQWITYTLNHLFALHIIECQLCFLQILKVSGCDNNPLVALDGMKLRLPAKWMHVKLWPEQRKFLLTYFIFVEDTSTILLWNMVSLSKWGNRWSQMPWYLSSTWSLCKSKPILIQVWLSCSMYFSGLPSSIYFDTFSIERLLIRDSLWLSLSSRPFV